MCGAVCILWCTGLRFVYVAMCMGPCMIRFVGLSVLCMECYVGLCVVCTVWCRGLLVMYGMRYLESCVLEFHTVSGNSGGVPEPRPPSSSIHPLPHPTSTL